MGELDRWFLDNRAATASSSMFQNQAAAGAAGAPAAAAAAATAALAALAATAAALAAKIQK